MACETRDETESAWHARLGMKLSLACETRDETESGTRD